VRLAVLDDDALDDELLARAIAFLRARVRLHPSVDVLPGDARGGRHDDEDRGEDDVARFHGPVIPGRGGRN